MRVSPLDPTELVLTFPHAPSRSLTFHERLAGGSSRALAVAPVAGEQGVFLRLLLDAASKLQWERGRGEVADMIRVLAQRAV
jgi:hypothetical protein